MESDGGTAGAYLEFAGRIEEALQKEVAVYIAKMTNAKESEESHSNVFRDSSPRYRSPSSNSPTRSDPDDIFFRTRR